MRAPLLALLLLPACGPSVLPADDDLAEADARPPGPDGTPPCRTPATPAGIDVELAPEFAAHYAAFDLGPVPGVPSALGGAVVQIDAPDPSSGQSDQLPVAGRRLPGRLLPVACLTV